MSVRFVVFVIAPLVLLFMICSFYFDTTQLEIRNKGYTLAKNPLISSISSVRYIDTPPKINEMEKDWMEQMEQKYRTINERILRVCRTYRERATQELDVDVSYIDQGLVIDMMLDPKHKLAYCQNAKVRHIHRRKST